MTNIILAIQVATYLALGSLFMSQGDWRFGVAQILLAFVQGVIYFV